MQSYEVEVVYQAKAKVVVNFVKNEQEARLLAVQQAKQNAQSYIDNSFFAANATKVDYDAPDPAILEGGYYILNSQGSYIDGPFGSYGETNHEFDIHSDDYSAYHAKHLSEEEAQDAFGHMFDQ